jgi:hypothetical protein
MEACRALIAQPVNNGVQITTGEENFALAA